MLHDVFRAFWQNPRDVRLAAVAQRTGYTPRYLNDIMRESTGSPLSTWLQGIRMSRARHELVTSARAIADVGADCGYDDAAYFSRVFARFHGVTRRRGGPHRA